MMLCDNCLKREATVRYEENINGERKKVNLCKECSDKLGIFNINFIDNMFMSFFDDPINIESEKLKEKDRNCPKCGYSFFDYVNTGLLGCSTCYETFKDKLEPVLHKLHGKTYHIKLKERTNKNDRNNSSIEELQEKLKQSIEKEEYEKAAVIRDEIKKLKERGEA